MCLTPTSTTLPVLPSKHINSVLKIACDAQNFKDDTNTSVIVGLVSLFNREQLGNGCIEKTVHVVWTRYVVNDSRLCAGAIWRIGAGVLGSTRVFPSELLLECFD